MRRAKNVLVIRKMQHFIDIGFYVVSDDGSTVRMSDGDRCVDIDRRGSCTWMSKESGE